MHDLFMKLLLRVIKGSLNHSEMVLVTKELS